MRKKLLKKVIEMADSPLKFTRAQIRVLILLKKQPDYHVLEYYNINPVDLCTVQKKPIFPTFIQVPSLIISAVNAMLTNGKKVFVSKA